MENPDEKFLTILKKDFPNQYSYKEINGEITHLHIYFSPSLLSENIVYLKSLVKITTDYKFEISDDEDIDIDDIQLIPDFLNRFLDDEEVRGIELWESEYEVMRWLVSSDDLMHPWFFFDDGSMDGWMDEGIFIRNGHITMLQHPFVDIDALEEAKKYLFKLTKLKYLEIKEYQVTIDMMEEFIEPDWLRRVADSIEYDFNHIEEYEREEYGL